MNAPSPSTNLASPFEKWFATDAYSALGGIGLMTHLFNRLDGLYPHWWRANFPTQEAIDNWAVSWAEAFEEAGLQPGDIKAGLKACRTKHDKSPSCAEFIKACRPDIDPLVAYYEAIAGMQARAKGEMGKWSSPAVYWAAVPLAFDLANQTYSQVKHRWEQALHEQMTRGEWAPIPQPMVALPAPGKSMLSREAAGKMLADLGATGVVTRIGESGAALAVDHKRWAKRIMERQRAGDKSLKPIQIKFAQQALKAVNVA